MQPDEIPMPAILDLSKRVPPHVAGDTEDNDEFRLQKMTSALTSVCEYSTMLWQQLAAVRSYLASSLPADAQAGGASPTGPDDDSGWTAWTETYAAVTSALAGPAGDSGYGVEQAGQMQRQRRIG